MSKGRIKFSAEIVRENLHLPGQIIDVKFEGNCFEFTLVNLDLPELPQGESPPLLQLDYTPEKWGVKQAG